MSLSHAVCKSQHFTIGLLRVRLNFNSSVLIQACAPYFEMLEKWIYKGIINDPYCEVSTQSINDDVTSHVIVVDLLTRLTYVT